MILELKFYETNAFLHDGHVGKNMDPHRHCMTDNSTRIHRNKIKRVEHGKTPLRQVTVMAINTTSLRRHWPTLAREEGVAHWACTEARTMKEDQLWFSERYTGEDKTNVTWEPPMDGREDGQPEFGGTCVISRQPASSVLFEKS